MSEAIGLRAILETREFQKGMKIYLSGLTVLDNKTNKTARGINTGLGNANKGFLRANKGALALGAGLLGLAGGVIIVKELAEGILKIGTASVGSAIDMEQQLANISSLMGGTAEDTEKLKGLITDLGLDPNLKVSATEAADSIEMLVKNGVTLDQIMDGAAKSSIALANATGSDFSTAADIATDAMSLFNIEAKDMNTAVDGVTSVLVNSKAGVNDYRLALGQGGSAAKIAGVSFEDFNAVIASSIDAFSGGASAGTGFRTFVQRLVPDTETAAAKMKELGLLTGLTETAFNKVSEKIEKANSKLVSLDPTSKNYAKTSAKLRQEIEELNDQLQVGGNAFFDSQGNMKSMAEVSRLLSDATKDLSNEQKISTFRTIFGQDAMGTASELAAAGAVTMITLADGTEVASTAFEELQKKMGEVNAANIIEKRMGTLKGALEVIGGVFETVGLKIGDTFLPGLKVLAKSFLNLTDKVMPLLEPMFVVMENSISVFSDKLSSVLAPAIENAIGLIGGLLGVNTNTEIGVGVGISGLDKLHDIDAFSGLGDTVELSFLDKIKDKFSEVSEVASDVMMTVKDVFSTAITFVTGTVVPGFGKLFDIIGGGGKSILTLSGVWEGAFKPAIQFIGSYIENILTPAFNVIIGILSTVLPPIIKTVSNIWTNVLFPAIAKVSEVFSLFVGKIEENLPVFQELAGSVIGSITAIAEGVLSTLGPAIDGAISLLNSLFGVDTEIGIEGTANLGFLDGIKEQFSSLPEIASEAMTIISGIFSSVITFVDDTVIPGFGRLFEAIAGGDGPALTLSGVWENIFKPALQSVGFFITDVLTPAFDIVVDTLGTILPPIIETVSSIWTNILLPAITQVGETFAFFMGVIQENMPVFQKLAEDAFGRLKTVIDFVSENVMPFFLEQLDKLFVFWEENGPLIISVIEKLGVFAQEAFTVFMEVVKVAWAVVSPIIGGAIDIILLLGKQVLQMVNGDWDDAWETGVEMVHAAMDAVEASIWSGVDAVLKLFGTDLQSAIESWEFVWDSIMTIFDRLVSDWTDNWDLVKQIAGGVWEKIKEGVVVWQGIWDNVKTIFSDAIQDWQDNWDLIKTTVTLIWDSITGDSGIIKTSIDTIKTFFSTTIGEAITTWETAWGNVKTAATLVWDSITGAVDTAIQAIKGFFSTTFDEALIAWQENWGKVKTIVETVWEEIKGFISGGISGLSTLFSGDASISNAMGGIMTKVSNAVSEAWGDIMILVTDKLQEWEDLIFETDWFVVGGDIIDLVADGIDGAIATVQTAVSGIVGQIRDTFGSADAFLSMGTNLIQGIIQGMNNSLALLTGAASGLATSILDAINSALGISSPSKKGVAIGENFTGSIEMGITSGAASLNRAATNLFDVSAISGAASKVARAISGSFSSVLGSIDGISDFAESLFDVKEISEGIFTAKNLFGSDRDFSFGEGGTTGTVNLLNNLEKQRNFLKTQEQLLGNIVKLGLDYESVTQGIVVGPAAGLLDTLKLQQRISEQLRNGDVARLESQVEFAKNQRSLSLEQQQSLKKARSLAEKFFNVSQANSNEVFAISGGDMVDISSDIVLSRIKALDTINKENDATVRQIKLLAQVKELGLDFEEATAGINILSPNILDSLILEKRINQEILDQNKERLRLTQDTAAAEEEIARKEAIIAGKEAEIKKIKQLQKIMSDIQAQATQGFDPADILNGITLGLDTSQDDLLDIMVNISRNALQAMQDEFEIASPSKKTTRFGEQLGEGLKMGVLRKERDVVNAMTSVSSSMVSAPVAPSADIQMQSNSVLTKLLTRALGRQSITNNVAMPVTNNISNGMQAAEATAMFGNQLAGVVGMPQ